MIKKLLLILAILLLSIAGLVSADTNVGGTISADTVWSGAGSPYILTNNIIISNGSTLTIDPGVEIQIPNKNFTINNGATVNIGAGVTVKTQGTSRRFLDGRRHSRRKYEKYGNIIVNGTLITQGTSSNPVTFTSRRDGSGATVGDWGYILFNESGSNNSILNYTNIKYARYDTRTKRRGENNRQYSKNEGISIKNSNISIKNSNISNSGHNYGILISGGTPTIENNTIENGGNGISVHNSNASISGNIIRNNTNWGIMFSNSSGIISNNTIENNGNGLNINGGTPTINNNNIINNTGIGLEYNPASGYNLNNNTITGNETAVSSNTLDLARSGDTNTISGNTNNNLYARHLTTTDNNLTITSENFDNIIITSNGTLPVGKTVNIAAGTIIKIRNNVKVEVQGTLKTLGTSSNRVIITSEDSNPTKGKWKYLKFSGAGSNGSQLEYTDIKYSGGETAGVRFYNSNATMDHCNVSEHNGYGIDVSESTSAPTITNNTISNNANGIYINGNDNANINNNTISENTTRGVYIKSSYDNFTDNTISNNGIAVRSATLDIAKDGDNNTISGNTNNFLYVDYFNIRNNTRTINNDRFDSIIISYNSTLSSGKTLNIQDGTIIKVNNGILLSSQGTINAQGTSSNNIIFTSINDNSIGGNSGTGTPIAGSWKGLEIKNTSSNSTNINYAIFRYAGGQIRQSGRKDGVAISLANTDSTIQNSIIENIKSQGINISGGAPTIDNITISNVEGSNSYGISTSSSDATITHNDIQGVKYGLSIIGGAPTIEYNTMSNNERGAYYSPTDYTKFANNTISNNTYPIKTGSLDFTMDGSNDQTNIFTGNTNNFLYVRGFNLSVNNATIDSGGFPSIIILGNSNLTNGKTLTIKPGTIIKFKNNISSTIYGTLNAIGTETDNIVFTSINDNSIGGNTGTGTPIAGSWKYIDISGNGSNASILNYTEIRYSGYSTYPGVKLTNTNATIQNSIINNVKNQGINISGGTPTVDNITISNVDGSTTHGISANSSDATITNNNIQGLTYGLNIVGGTPTIEYNTISNNDWGVYLSIADYSKFKNNTISNNIYPIKTAKLDFIIDSASNQTNVFTGNNKNSIYIEQFNINTNSGTINNGIFDSIVITSSSGLTSGKTLTISPGTVIKCGNSVYINIKGILNAIGTEENKIIFTSINDHSIGGATGTGSPSAGNWRYIQFQNSNSNNSIIEHSIIKYASNGVHFTNTEATLEKSIITKNSHGVQIDSGSPTVNRNTIANNNIGIYIQNGTPIIKNTIIARNSSKGIQKISGTPIVKYNLVGGNSSSDVTGMSTDDTNIIGPDPMFLDESSYDLLDGSPAINKADPALGTHPVSNNRYDIGVIESLGTSRYLYKNFSANITTDYHGTLYYSWEFVEDPTDGQNMPTIYNSTGTFTRNNGNNLGCSSILSKLGTYRIKLTIRKNNSSGEIVGQGDRVFHIVKQISN